MKLLKMLSLASLLFLSATIPAFAGISVSAPANGSSVGSPFTVSAVASACSNQPITSIGFSMDSSTYTATVSGSSLNTWASAAAGGHTIHFKSWGNAGAVCTADVGIIVGTASGVPSYAATTSALQTVNSWNVVHDTGTPGSSSGWSGTTNSPSLTGAARHFATSYNYYGGERYSLWFGDDNASHSFLYDVWVYIENYNTGIANIEMDVNQTMQNGQTAIFGFQCNGWTSTWDYTVNKGSPTSPNDQWVHSSQYCNVRNWSLNTWHHVQVYYSRDDSGYVTYHWVSLDGTQQNLNITALSAFALGWGPTLLTNFQVDGATSGSGSSNVYIDKLTVSRW